MTQLKPLPEHKEQMLLVEWMTRSNILFFHVPNGGYRHLKEAAKFKRMGVQAGVPDIVIPMPRDPYHGMFLELKRSKGGLLTESQIRWANYLCLHGYYVTVANGFEQAMEQIKFYLRLNRKESDDVATHAIKTKEFSC